MIDQLISFETAKLAKEKGFNEGTEKYYLTGSSYIPDGFVGTRIIGLSFNEIEPKGMFSAPTQSLLQKWLREKYNIVVLISRWINGHHKLYYHPIIDGVTFKSPGYITYEEALETGLRQALKLIK